MANGTLKVGTITTSTGSGTITIPSGVTLSGGGIDILLLLKHICLEIKHFLITL